MNRSTQVGRNILRPVATSGPRGTFSVLSVESKDCCFRKRLSVERQRCSCGGFYGSEDCVKSCIKAGDPRDFNTTSHIKPNPNQAIAPHDLCQRQARSPRVAFDSDNQRGAVVGPGRLRRRRRQP